MASVRSSPEATHCLPPGSHLGRARGQSQKAAARPDNTLQTTGKPPPARRDRPAPFPRQPAFPELAGGPSPAANPAHARSSGLAIMAAAQPSQAAVEGLLSLLSPTSKAALPHSPAFSTPGLARSPAS